jgi:hypothetical protein
MTDVRAHNHRRFFSMSRLCAVLLIVLMALPSTAPFRTFELAVAGVAQMVDTLANERISQHAAVWAIFSPIAPGSFLAVSSVAMVADRTVVFRLQPTILRL